MSICELVLFQYRCLEFLNIVLSCLLINVFVMFFPCLETMIEKTKAFEEEKLKALQKFETLKNAYNVMREEHISLLRKKAEVDKQMVVVKKSTLEKDAKIEMLQSTVNELSLEKSRISETFTKNSDDAKSEVNLIKQELENATQKYRDEIEVLKKTLSDSECALTTQNDEYIEKFEKHNLEREQLETEISNLVLEKDDLKKQLLELTENYDKKKQTFKLQFSQSQMEIEKFVEEIAKLENEKKVTVWDFSFILINFIHRN